MITFGVMVQGQAMIMVRVRFMVSVKVTVRARIVFTVTVRCQDNGYGQDQVLRLDLGFTQHFAFIVGERLREREEGL